MPFDINVALAWAIVDTVREPFLVLDRDLRASLCKPILLRDFPDRAQ